MDKSTQVVIENHQDLEKIYQDPKNSRNFKEVSKDTAKEGRPTIHQHLDGTAVPYSRNHCGVVAGHQRKLQCHIHPVPMSSVVNPDSYEMQTQIIGPEPPNHFVVIDVWDGLIGMPKSTD